MPYFIYKIRSGEKPAPGKPELISEYENYKQAKQEVKAMRIAQPEDTGYRYRFIFADNQQEAEQRLLEHREQPIVREWEK